MDYRVEKDTMVKVKVLQISIGVATDSEIKRKF